MRSWILEIAGWLLVLLGLFVFYVCFSILLAPRPLLLQSVPLTIIGFIVFRGGIYLLKLGVAARICLNAQKVARGQDGKKEAVKRTTMVVMQR
jgi:hypothetical protein